MKVKRIIFDWFICEYGEEYKEYEIDKNKVIDIKENAAKGEGDKWHYDITFSDATMERIFNINKVFYQAKL